MWVWEVTVSGQSSPGSPSQTPTCPLARTVSASGLPEKRIFPRLMTASCPQTDWTSSMMWVLPGEGGEEVPHPDPLLRVEADGRLVEDEQLRVPEKRLGDADPLPLAAREGADFLFPEV